jgi:hypothetical protein
MNRDGLPKFKFKRDSYMKRRGAPAMLMISCAGCSHYLMSYQKDGPGPLLRCYLDRIHHPEELEKRQYLAFDKKTTQKLACANCHEVVGTPIVYEKEDRPAYHMRQGFFSIKKVKKTKATRIDCQ